MLQINGNIQRRNFEKKIYEVSINCHIWLRVVLGQSFYCPSDQQKWSHVDDGTNLRLVTFWEVHLPFIASLSYKASISVQWWELLDLPHIHVIDNACRLARMIQLSSVAHPISCILCRDIGLSRGKRFFFCGSALPPPSPFRIVFSSCVPLRLRRLPTTPYLVSHEVNVVSLLYLWEAFATATCKILILPLLQLDCHDFERSLRWNKKMNYKLIYETDFIWKISHLLSTRFSRTFAYPLYRYFIVLWFGFLRVLKAWSKCRLNCKI